MNLFTKQKYTHAQKIDSSKIDVQNKFQIVKGTSWGREKLGDWDCHVDNAIYNIGN